MKNHSSFIQKLAKWQDQYEGKRPPKNFPHERAANVAIPVTRYLIDTLFVRILDVIFGQKKIVVVKARKPEFVGTDTEIENQLNWFSKNILKLKKKLKSPLFQGLKMGSGFGKIVWESKKRTVYRYADEMELLDPSVKKYKAGEGSKVVKQVISTYEGPNIYPVPREDMIWSSDATSIQDAYLIGFKKLYRRAEIDLKVKQGLWDKKEAEKLVSTDKTDETKEARSAAQEKGLETTKYGEPYEIWELWLKYDVDDDGEEDDIVVTIHRESGAILRAIYSPIFYGFRPFFDLTGYIREYSLEGMGLCPVLEKSQEEVDSMHNQRLDRVTAINAPMTITRDGAFPDQDFKRVPGKNWVTQEDPATCIRIRRGASLLPHHGAGGGQAYRPDDEGGWDRA